MPASSSIQIAPPVTGPGRAGSRLTALHDTLRRRFFEPLAFVAPLATRVVLGLAFCQAGTGKLANLGPTTAFFAGLGIPLPAANALFIGSLETVGGVALILGLATRPFAALLTSTMVVALFTADRASFLASWTAAGEQSPTDVVPFVFLLFLLWLVLLGPGKASIDHLFARRAAAR